MENLELGRGGESLLVLSTGGVVIVAPRLSTNEECRCSGVWLCLHDPRKVKS